MNITLDYMKGFRKVRKHKDSDGRMVVNKIENEEYVRLENDILPK